MFVLQLFSPPSPSITRTFPPELMKVLIAFNSNPVNLLRGPGRTKTFPFSNDSCERTSLFLKKFEQPNIF